MSNLPIRTSTSVANLLVQGLDFLAICSAGWAAYVLRFGWNDLTYEIQSNYRLFVPSVAFSAALLFSKVYRMWPGGSLPAMVGRVFAGWLLSWTLLIVLLALTKSTELFSRIWLVTWLGLGLVTLAMARVMAFFFMAALRRSGYQHKSVLLYGDSAVMDDVRARITQSSWSGFNIVESIVHGDGKDLLSLDAKLKPDEIWISLSMADQLQLDSVLVSLQQSVANIRLLPDLHMYQILNHGMSIRMGIPMVDISVSPMFGGRKIAKAFLDFSVAFIALIIFSPIMIAIAIGIKMTSKGPVLFQQKRHGWNGEEIWVYKFRSMEVHQESQGSVTQATRSDPRVTQFGKFLRKSSLDELPQFINVLQGRMSVVGPRPHALAHNYQYTQNIPRYALRHKVKPGITGWAQVCGFRGETESLAKMEGRIKHDLYYLEHWSIWMDIKIILMTPLATIQNKNVF